jgi:hypothetical protein
VNETFLKNPHVEKFEFKLTKSNSESLERNIEFTIKYMVEMIHWRSGGREHLPKMFWNWVYPTIERKKEETPIQ